MPRYGLQLLASIIERNSAFVTILKKLKLIDIMLEYFTLGHEKFNTHLIKIVCGIVESKELDLEYLTRNNSSSTSSSSNNDENIIVKLNLILKKNMDSDQEGWCLESLLDIIYEFLHYVAEHVKDSVKDLAIDSFNLLMENFEYCMKLLLNSDHHIIEKAS